MSDYTVTVDAAGERWGWMIKGAGLNDTALFGSSRRIIDVEDDARSEIVKACPKELLYSQFSVDVVMARPYDYSTYDSSDPLRPVRRIICDIDGTLAIHAERGPYDMEKLHTDVPNDAVDLVLRSLYHSGLGIILMSGRDEKYREATERWLERYLIPYDELHMRPRGDVRSDDIVKLELFDKHVRDRYWPWLVLDDRDRCVYLWRRLGLTTWQVAPGDF